MGDVAALAGVSSQTVSRVLHGYTAVTSYTRTRVLSAIDELGYRPNNAARSLVTGRAARSGCSCSTVLSTVRCPPLRHRGGCA